jgi:hypothetical protein
VLVVLSSLLFILPTLAAHSKGQIGAGHLPSLFTLEHPVGKVAVGGRTTSGFSCGTAAKPGNLLINVTEIVSNDGDSGQAGNYWGLDAFTRTFSVWNTGPDAYCAVVLYKGTFAAQALQKSPGTTVTPPAGGILSGEEVGTMQGGYEALITGALSVSDPTNWPLVGKINGGKVVNYQCVIATLTENCPGYVDWTAKYFDTANAQVKFSFAQPAWGWTYIGKDKKGSPDAGKSAGTWINALTGNSGDILDQGI